MIAFLLAAGFGSRLMPLTRLYAKPAMPWLGVPFAGHCAQWLLQHGAEHLFYNTHHLPQTVQSALSGYAATELWEPTILGTGGALIQFNQQRATWNDSWRAQTVVVVNGKLKVDFDLTQQLQAHEASGAAVTLIARPNPSRLPFTHVDYDHAQTHSAGNLRGFVSKEHLHTVAQPLLFTGVQLLSPRFWSLIPRTLPPSDAAPCDTIQDLYPLITAAHHTLRVALVEEGEWHECSTPLRYLNAHLEVTHGRGFIDPGAQIMAGGDVRESIVWSGAQIPAGARLTRCIVTPGAVITPGVHYENLILMPGQAPTPLGTV